MNWPEKEVSDWASLNMACLDHTQPIMPYKDSSMDQIHWVFFFLQGCHVFFHVNSKPEFSLCSAQATINPRVSRLNGPFVNYLFHFATCNFLSPMRKDQEKEIFQLALQPFKYSEGICALLFSKVLLPHYKNQQASNLSPPQTQKFSFSNLQFNDYYSQAAWSSNRWSNSTQMVCFIERRCVQEVHVSRQSSSAQGFWWRIIVQSILVWEIFWSFWCLPTVGVWCRYLVGWSQKLWSKQYCWLVSNRSRLCTKSRSTR